MYIRTASRQLTCRGVATQGRQSTNNDMSPSKSKATSAFPCFFAYFVCFRPRRPSTVVNLTTIDDRRGENQNKTNMYKRTCIYLCMHIRIPVIRRKTEITHVYIGIHTNIAQKRGYRFVCRFTYLFLLSQFRPARRPTRPAGQGHTHNLNPTGTNDGDTGYQQHNVDNSNVPHRDLTPCMRINMKRYMLVRHANTNL